MRASILVSKGQLETTDLDSPLPTSADQVVVRVRAAGVCGTDLHFLEGLLDPSGYPRVLGHEIAGVLVEGDQSSEARGRVAVYNVLFCGECSYCRSGRQRLCTSSKGMLGFSVDGGFAEYLVVPRRNLVPIPEGLSFDSAAVLACSGMSAVHAVRLSRIGLGDVALVHGVGGVGLMVIQVAKAAGVRVIAVGDSPDKLDLAVTSGADHTILVRGTDGYANLNDELSKLAVRPVAYFETVGTTESIIAGLVALAPGGSFVQIGYTGDNIDVHPAMLIKNELRLITSAAGSLSDLETAIRLAESGALVPTISQIDGLEELPKALDAIKNRTVLGRSVITFS